MRWHINQTCPKRRQRVCLVYKRRKRDVEKEQKIERQQESMQALTLAGIPLSNMYFLQYPDTEVDGNAKCNDIIRYFCKSSKYNSSIRIQTRRNIKPRNDISRRRSGALREHGHNGLRVTRGHKLKLIFNPNLFVDITDVITKKSS